MDPFSHVDYREYLRDLYEDQKSQNPSFSLQSMGDQLDIDASHLSMTLAGERHLPAETIPALIKLCGLEDHEAEYLENLIHFEQAKTEKETQAYFDKLIRLRSKRGHIASNAQLALPSKWHFTAIRAMLGLCDWTYEYAEIAQLLDPPLDSNQVEQAIEYMLENGLATRGDSGVLQPADQRIDSDPVPLATQQEARNSARQSMETRVPQVSDISTLPDTISSEGMNHIREIFTNFRESIRLQMAHNTNPDDIYQIDGSQLKAAQT